MTTTFSVYERRPGDDYPTPVEAVDVLFSSPWPPGDSWDPCCGKLKNILAAVRSFGRQVKGTDIIFGKKYDFLTAPFPSTEWDIVTNPPFGTQGRLALKFIERSLELTALHHCRVMMLLPIDYDSGSTRAHVFGKCPRFAHKIILLNRVRIFNGQSGTTNHAWYIWDGYEKDRQPTLSYAKIIYKKPAPKRVDK